MRSVQNVLGFCTVCIKQNSWSLFNSQLFKRAAGAGTIYERTQPFQLFQDQNIFSFKLK